MSNLIKVLNRKTVGEKKFGQMGENYRVEKKVIRESNYKTNGESLIVIKGVDKCDLTLDSSTTEHIIVKSLTRVIIKPSKNYIDEFYEEIQINRGACVEFYLLEDNWYIVSSDGLKLD